MGTSNVAEHSASTQQQHAQQQIDSTAIPAATIVAPKLIDLTNNNDAENEVWETQLNK
jgi:hypothetical protein